MGMPSLKSLRHTWTLLFAISLLVMLSACGGGGGGGGGGTGASAKGPANALNACPKTSTTTAASAESGKVTLNVAGWSSSPAEDALVQQELNTFMQQNPNISVTWSIIPGDYPTKMRANIASGNVPDVFYLQPPMAQEYIKGGKLLNLSPYMGRDNVSPSTYSDSLLKPFNCADGTVYGIPKDWNSLGLFYNKTMFQQAGLSDPSNWTWNDLKNAAQKLTKPGVVGLSLSADASRWGAFLYADGGQMVSSDGTQAAFNSSQGMDAATFYTSLVTNHFAAQPSDVGAGWNGEAFGKQEAAMTFEGGWMIPYMSQTFPSVQYGIAPMPQGPSGKAADLLFTNAWAAYSGTKHPDAAWKLIKFLTGTSNQTTVLHAGFALPTVKSLSSDSYFSQNPGVKVLFDGATNGYADFYGAADNEIHSEVSNALKAVMLGQASVQDAMNKAAQNVNTWIQQNAAP